MKKVLLILVLVGIIDSGYLVKEHYSQVIPPCVENTVLPVDCGAVLRSEYAVMFGVPLAVLGLMHYTLLLVWLIKSQKRWGRYLAIVEGTGGAVFSIYLVYLQLGVIHAICLYCMLSALVSIGIFILVMRTFREERKRVTARLGSLIYKCFAKPILFLIDPELVHIVTTRFGEKLIIPNWVFKEQTQIFEQELMGINFKFPIGLAAGFDYESRLTNTLSPLGFGFQSVGTITNEPWEGNEKPRLGRLPKSQSLMVNKGFRNPGVDEIIEKLKGKKFKIPVGISIGDAMGEIKNIIEAFSKLGKAKLSNSYYELNISCPNLPKAKTLDLEELLIKLDKLKIKKPIWVKMPINKSDKEILEMLELISRHCPKAVIFGNLQKDRNDPSLDRDEVAKFPVGNFSGKPTFERSNQLIRLAYKHFKERFVIVGCGGVFNARDAYTKIKLGASLVQMITGMVFEGPTVVAEINFGLKDFLEKEGVEDVSIVVGNGQI